MESYPIIGDKKLRNKSSALLSLVSISLQTLIDTDINQNIAEIILSCVLRWFEIGWIYVVTSCKTAFQSTQNEASRDPFCQLFRTIHLRKVAAIWVFIFLFYVSMWYFFVLLCAQSFFSLVYPISDGFSLYSQNSERCSFRVLSQKENRKKFSTWRRMVVEELCGFPGDDDKRIEDKRTRKSVSCVKFEWNNGKKVSTTLRICCAEEIGGKRNETWNEIWYVF